MRHLILISMLTFTFSSSYAVKGYDVNGGDLCEQRIGAIALNLNDWLNEDGGMDLSFPKGVSYASYKEAMLASISKAKVFCIDKKINLGVAEKSCINTYNIKEVKSYLPDDVSGADYEHLVRSKDPVIICNYGKFLNAPADEQFLLTHHEYAGLAGVETNNGDINSDYSISNQITDKISDVIVRKLPVNTVCGRTKIVRTQIEQSLKMDCSKIKPRDLKSVKSLNLYGLSHIKASDFKGLTSLDSLGLSEGQFKFIPENAFDPFRKSLKVLYLTYNNSFGKISKNLLRGMNELKELRVSDSPIKQIEAGAFNDLKSLKLLSFIHTSIVSDGVPFDVFSELTELEDLYFYNVLLTRWDDNLLRTQRKLKTLILGSPRLRSFNRPFDSLENLETLNFTVRNFKKGKHMICTPKMGQLKKANLLKDFGIPPESFYLSQAVVFLRYNIL